MEITVVVENLVYQKGLKAEHGLSLYFEDGGKRFLFDTGQSHCFYDNARKLGVDISKVDYLIISHGHYDHTGGMKEFMKRNERAQIIIQKEAFVPKYHHGKYIGMPHNFNLSEKRLQYPGRKMWLSDHVCVMGRPQIVYEDDCHRLGFHIGNHDELREDSFQDELFICITQNGQLSIISACSHNGISNMIESAKKEFQLPLQSIVGGLHLQNESEKALMRLCQRLEFQQVKNLALGHCTGVEAYSFLKEHCRIRLGYLHTGKKTIINK